MVLADQYVFSLKWFAVKLFYSLQTLVVCALVGTRKLNWSGLYKTQVIWCFRPFITAPDFNFHYAELLEFSAMYPYAMLWLSWYHSYFLVTQTLWLEHDKVSIHYWDCFNLMEHNVFLFWVYLNAQSNIHLIDSPTCRAWLSQTC